PGVAFSWGAAHQDLLSPAVSRPSSSALMEGQIPKPAAPSITGPEAQTAGPSLIRFNVQTDGSGGGSSGPSSSRRRRRKTAETTTDDTSDVQDEGESDRSSDRKKGVLHTRIQTNPIRFHEPLTATSRQDRRVVKGGIAIVQVKWDSDRKRRQGYFAPDNGNEKSPFRHYSKDDCCFDD
ncbi:hypothetical protein FA15DRAFT_662148, partial [Coprinopsis marcescibilis]